MTAFFDGDGILSGGDGIFQTVTVFFAFVGFSLQFSAWLCKHARCVFHAILIVLMFDSTNDMTSLQHTFEKRGDV